MQVVSTAINGALWHVVRAWQAVGVARRGSLISSALPKPICGAAARVATGATGATGAKAAELETIASMAEIKSDDLSEHGGMHNAQRSSAGRRERTAATDLGWHAAEKAQVWADHDKAYGIDREIRQLISFKLGFRRIVMTSQSNLCRFRRLATSLCNVLPCKVLHSDYRYANTCVDVGYM